MEVHEIQAFPSDQDLILCVEKDPDLDLDLAADQDQDLAEKDAEKSPDQDSDLFQKLKYWLMKVKAFKANTADKNLTLGCKTSPSY